MSVTATIKTASLLKRYWKPILIGLFIIIMGFLFLPVIILGAFIPGADDDKLRLYISTGNELGISWQDLITFDMVLHKNELQEMDPNDSAKYFIQVHYEEFVPSHTVCVRYEEDVCVTTKHVPERVTFIQTAVGYKQVDKFFRGYGSGSTLKQKIDSINNNSDRRVLITPLSAEQAMSDARFTERQREEFYDQQKSGVLQEMFPEFEGMGLISGACINDVSPDGKAKANATVNSYTSLIKKYAEQFGVPQYVEVIKAIMMAESGGSGKDPMQASESGFANQVSSCVGKSGAGRIGCIKNPEDSIKVGVQVFKSTLNGSNFDIAVAIQSYNFGPYFSTWIRENGGKYTVELAKRYSQTVMAAAGQGLGTPTHAQKVLTQYYQHEGCSTGSISPEMIGANDWVWPTQSKRVTSGFGPRNSPCVGCSSFHPAIDIGATRPGVDGDQVWTMADGVVISTQYIDTGGNSVFVDHGNGVVSRYLHLKNSIVKNGQKVTKGQVIAYMGNTGSSTATHLDFQIKINGTAVDPLALFPNI